jgi:hypothetical protein
MAKEHNTNPEPGVTGEASEVTVLLADDDAAIRRLAGQVLRSSDTRCLKPRTAWKR